VEPSDGLSTLSPQNLQRELDLAIEKEDYERAGMIRDEMDRRSNT
jgi:protein-arginine kinase activator protein McsA